MARKSTANTFEKGLVMDLNPITTPNNVMTSALNVTMITFNGNEYVLQSDMGNGRVETAYLPSGYVPVGIVEFGGIIYVASYNPLIGKSQLGSFPSPERNISTEEINQNVVDLSNSDFGFNTTNGASTFYVQKNLYPDKLTPGDKYIVYTKIGSVSGNNNKLWDCADGSNNAVNIGGQNVTKAVKLSFATITDEGKIVKLSNLRTYKVNGINGEFIVPEISYNGSKPNLDSYRSLVESPYNIFNSKVSGKLLLIAELVTIDEFNVSISCEFVGPDTAEVKDVKISTNLSYASDNNVFLFAVDAKLVDSQLGARSLNFKWNKTTVEGATQIVDNREGNALMYTVQGYDYINRTERSVSYNITPCMSFGPIKYLMRSGIIQLDKIGTGYISLYEWRYYVDNNNIMINWALQSYPEEGYEIAGVRFVMSCIDIEGNEKTSIYNVSKKQSYNGSFMENIPFESDFYKFSQGNLLRDRLYYVTIEIQYQKIVSSAGEDITGRYKYFHRWLYTDNSFNEYYLEGKIFDFEEIPKNISFSITSTSKTEKINGETREVYGRYSMNIEEIEERLENEDTICAVEKYSEYTLDGNIKFQTSSPSIDVDKKTVNIELKISNDDNTIAFDKNNIVSFNNSDVPFNAGSYIGLKQNKDWDGNIIDLPVSEETKQLIEDKYSHGIYVGDSGETIINVTADKSDFRDIKVRTVEFVKAYSNLKETPVQYGGTIRPLILSSSDLERYNLVVDPGKTRCNSRLAFGYGKSKHKGNGASCRDRFSNITNGVWNNVEVGYGTRKNRVNIDNDENHAAIERAYPTTSTIFGVVWSYKDKKYCTLKRPRNATYNRNWGRGGWIRNDSHCSNSGHERILEADNCIHVFMKRVSDDRYIMLNMGARVGSVYNQYYSRPQNIVFEPSKSSICSGMASIYNCIATMLAQIYYRTTEGGNMKFQMPSDIYFIKDFITTFNINISIKVTNPDGFKYTVKVNNDKIIYIDGSFKKNMFDLNYAVTNNQNDKFENLDYDTIDRNIKFFTSEIEYTSPIQIQTINSGTPLADAISQSMKASYKSVVQNIDGSSGFSDIESSKLLYINKSNLASVIDSNFEIYKIDRWDDSNQNRIKCSLNKNYAEKSNMGFVNKFTIKNDYLYFDDINNSSNIICDAHGRNDTDSTCGAWARFAPFKDLQIFNV